MGLGHRWREVEQMYADVNQLFGDIVKVTPSSKVVGDMALYLLSKGMTCAEVEELPEDHSVAFPDSVADMMSGSLGVPPDGWPTKVQKVLLRGVKPIEGRAGAKLPPADFDEVKATLTAELGRVPDWTEVLSHLMYPQVFKDYMAKRTSYSNVSVLPTPVFFYGMKTGEEWTIDLEEGKRLVVKFLAVGDPHKDGTRTIFFELNGQPREVRVRDESLKSEEKARPKADPNAAGQVGAPTPGLVTGLFVQLGDDVKRNDKLLTLEAMKMQSTIYAPVDGKVVNVLVAPGEQVDAKDLLAVVE
jgi:pyruvate carboxylase